MEILNQRHIFDDKYDEENSFDDCILNEVRKKIGNQEIGKIFKVNTDMSLSIAVDENAFRNLSVSFENELQSKQCLIPNLKLKATFTQYIDVMQNEPFYSNNETWANETLESRETYKFYLEFPSFAIINEVIVLSLISEFSK